MNKKQLTDNATSSVAKNARQGNVFAVQQWINAGGRYNSKKQGVIMLAAAEGGHIDILQPIIGCKAVSTGDLTDALRTTCFYGHLPAVQLLVNKLGRHCNSRLLDNLLHFAASRCHTDMMNWLLLLTHPSSANYIMRWT